jgi:FkbM family methyltransferase
MAHMRSFIPHVGWLNHPDNEELVALLQRGYFEAAEQAFFWLYLRPGDSIIDCGAHIGLFSLLACKATNGALDLTAIEANSDTFSFLKRNLDDADFRPTGVLNAAVWDRSGNLGFIQGDIGKSAYSRVDFDQDVQHQVTVPAIILDDVVKSKTIALIKIDVEGSESEALTGACRSISKRSLPLIMIEFTEANLARRGRTSSDLARQLESGGYQLCEFCTDKLELVPFQVAAPIWYKNIFACLDFRSVNSRLSSAGAENRQIAMDVIARARACSLFSELEELDNYKKSAELLTETRQWALRTEDLLARERQQLAQTEEWAKRTEGHLASARLQLKGVTERVRRLEQDLFELKPPADAFSHLHKDYMKYKDLKVDICICTHNPRPDVLHTTICSIIQQM